MEDKYKALEDAEAVIICMAKGTPTPFDDNHETNCTLCGCELIVRPYVDLEAMKPLCMKCGMIVMREHKDPIEKIQALPEAQAEFDAIHGAGSTDKALEMAKIEAVMAQAFSGIEALETGNTYETDTHFTCVICGVTYAKGRTDEEALAELEQNFPGTDKEDCAAICGSCNQDLLAWEASQK